jgi:hypothetical protein
MNGYTLPTADIPVDYCTPDAHTDPPENAFASGDCCERWKKLIDGGLYRIKPAGDYTEAIWSADVGNGDLGAEYYWFSYCPFCGSPRNQKHKRQKRCSDSLDRIGEEQFASGSGVFLRAEDDWVCRKGRNLSHRCRDHKIIFKFCPQCGGKR